jgi:hypothetical protein
MVDHSVLVPGVVEGIEGLAGFRVVLARRLTPAM